VLIALNRNQAARSASPASLIHERSK
jgi:hypothetical protein